MYAFNDPEIVPLTVPGPSVHEREGDVAVYEGNARLAKACYGRAVEEYLEDRRYPAAIQACRKLLEVAPGVVRIQFTLAFLLLGQRRVTEARRALRDYVDAVFRTRTQRFAAPRLHLLARVTEHPAMLTTIGALLVEIGAPEEGSEVLATAERAGAADAGLGSVASEGWERLLPLALRDPWCPSSPAGRSAALA